MNLCDREPLALILSCLVVFPFFVTLEAHKLVTCSFLVSVLLVKPPLMMDRIQGLLEAPSLTLCLAYAHHGKLTTE